MDSEEEKLVAPCGLYCGACSIRLAGKRGGLKLLKQIDGASVRFYTYRWTQNATMAGDSSSMNGKIA
jgi:hypothetical protein